MSSKSFYELLSSFYPIATIEDMNFMSLGEWRASFDKAARTGPQAIWVRNCGFVCFDYDDIEAPSKGTGIQLFISHNIIQFPDWARTNASNVYAQYERDMGWTS